MKQRFRKTPTSQRKVYKYYDANERCVAVIHPGDDNQVSEIHIKILHSMDDAEVYNNCKNKTTTPVSGKARHVDVCMGFPYSSYWVLSLEWLEDEALMGSTEHRKLLAQAYSDEEQRRHDVRKELLYEAVDCLPDAEQRLFRQYYIEDMTQPEIAKLEGISVPAVQKRRKKLINHLKEIIFKEILLGG